MIVGPAIQLLLDGEVPDRDQIVLQLLLHKVVTSPVAVNCSLVNHPTNVLQANIINPLHFVQTMIIFSLVMKPNVYKGIAINGPARLCRIINGLELWQLLIRTNLYAPLYICFQFCAAPWGRKGSGVKGKR